MFAFAMFALLTSACTTEVPVTSSPTVMPTSVPNPEPTPEIGTEADVESATFSTDTLDWTGWVVIDTYVECWEANSRWRERYKSLEREIWPIAADRGLEWIESWVMAGNRKLEEDCTALGKGLDPYLLP